MGFKARWGASIEHLNKGGNTVMIVRLIVFAAMALSVAACSKSGPPPISSGERYVTGASISETYRLGAGDKVHMSVFSEQQLGGDFFVSGDGKLSLPLIGDVDAVGKTTAEVARMVEISLGNGYLRNPRVSMEVISYRPFFILGEVKSPGQYPYANGLTVINAIATAQGFTPRAFKKYVFIRGLGEQIEQKFLLTADLRVQPGDTIRLTERYF